VADQASKVLEEGLERFPDSAALHERLRRSLLEAKGGEGLEAAYAELLRARGDSASLREFAGTARVAAAEFFRGRRDPARAFAAYDRAIEDFDRAIAADPRRRDDLDRAAALVHAGRARLAFQTGEDGRAVDAILESFRRGPSAAGDKDALGFTPGETGKILANRLRARGKEDLAKRVEAALALLDQELLRPDRE
jgi:tetratricopeptide (TPR) repeat protein